MATIIEKKGIKFELSNVHECELYKHRYLRKNNHSYIHFIAEYGKQTCNMLKWCEDISQYIPCGELMNNIDTLTIEQVYGL